jgi:hypothetical protein
MPEYCLRLLEDRIDPASPHVYLPAASRAIYVRDGEVSIEAAESGQHVVAGATWLGDAPIAISTLHAPATLWRWELVPQRPATSGVLGTAPAARSVCKLAATIELDDAQQWLMRIDRVGFPPGGVALTHVHQGPGIRCVLHGEITIEVGGASHRYKAGEAWLERGHEPVLAPTTEAEPTAFVRCFILPRACKARSSIRYVRPEDQAKPKMQTYLVFGERFITLPSQPA